MSIRSFDRSRLAWWIVAAVFGGVVLLTVYSFIGTFVFGIFVYYATRPVYRRIHPYTRHRNVAAALSLLLVALPAILLVAYTLSTGLTEFAEFLSTTQFDDLEAALQPYLDLTATLGDPATFLTRENGQTVQQGLASVIGYLISVAQILLNLFIMLVVAFYLLRDDHKLSRWFRERFGDEEGVLDAYLDRVDEDYHDIFVGNILNMVLTGIIGAIAYNALDLVAPPDISIPFPTLLGLLTGAASLIPVVGMKLVYFPVTGYLVAVAFFGEVPNSAFWFPLAFFLVSLIIVDTIPDLVLRPYVSGRNLHIGLVMLSYIFGPLLFGWYGLFLGPMLLVLIIHFARLVLPELLTGEPIRPWAVSDSTDTTSGTDETGDVGDEPEPRPDPGSEPDPDEDEIETEEDVKSTPPEDRRRAESDG